MLHKALWCSSSLPVIERLLELHPASASHSPRDTGLPLHTALGRMAASDVVLALLKAYPEAASRPASSGTSPSYAIHLAARWGAAEEVVNELLRLFPKGAAMKVRVCLH